MNTRAGTTLRARVLTGLLLLATAAVGLPAAPSGGRLAEGTDATVTRANRQLPRRAAEPATLYANDTIRTGAQRATIRWEDGSRAVLGENTEVVLKASDRGDDALFLLVKSGEVAYTFALEAPLRVGFWTAPDASLDGSASGLPLTGYLAAGPGGQRTFRPVDLATIGAARGDDADGGTSAERRSTSTADEVGGQLEASRQYDEISRHKVLFAVGSAPGGLVVNTITPEGGGEVTVISEGVPDASEPRWSPDLNRIVYQRHVGTSYDLVIHNVSRVGLGDEIKVLTDTPNINETEPVWGDGYIYFISDEDGDTAVYRMNYDGDKRKRITVPSLRALSPDQRNLSPVAGHSTDLVFSAWNGTDRDIYRIAPDGDIDTLAVVRELPGSNETNPRWSPDGKEVAFVTDAYGPKNIQVWNVEDGELAIEAVLPNTAAEIFYTQNLDFAYSPSGDRFVVTYNSSPGPGNDSLAVVDREGNIVRILDHGYGSGVFIANPDWLGGALPFAWWPTETVLAGAAIGAGVAAVGVIGVVVYDLVDDDDDDDDDDVRVPRSPFRPIR